MTANTLDFPFPAVGSAKPAARSVPAPLTQHGSQRGAGPLDGGPRALPEPSINAPAPKEVRVSQTGTYGQEFCEVSKESLRRHQMPTGADVVEDAAQKAERIIAAEHRGMGDTLDAAMHRAAARWGVPHSTFWSLRYRRDQIADLKGSIVRRLDAAVAYVIARQEVRLREEIEHTKKVLGDEASRCTALRQAETLVDQDEIPDPVPMTTGAST